MMKQKVVIRLQVHDQKDQRKAMKIAVGVTGVIAASLEGEDKSKMVVIGEGTDSVILTRSFRKKMGFAELISVGPADEKKEEKKEEKGGEMVSAYQAYQTSVPQHYVYQYHDTNYDPCCIM
ncbi:heavy metal-associated isoprenylated plant protein 16-like [Tasmannia lanceolata]|uniref:heavy metal-associated isoprenylated plant protein 16-like n=1 Tax=Tasmannia lanceolata TaxID=3420 RepID=UPI0040629291